MAQTTERSPNGVMGQTYTFVAKSEAVSIGSIFATAIAISVPTANNVSISVPSANDVSITESP